MFRQRYVVYINREESTVRIDTVCVSMCVCVYERVCARRDKSTIRVDSGQTKEHNHPTAEQPEFQ